MKSKGNVRLEQKLALVIDDEKVTRYIYDEGKTYNGITVMRRDLCIDIYDNILSKKIATVYNVKSFEIKKKCIVTYNLINECGAFLYNGTQLLECQYNRIVEYGDYLIATLNDGTKALYKFVNNRLAAIIESGEFSDIKISRSGIIVHKEKDEVIYKGYYSLDGKPIIPPLYTELSFAQKGIYVYKDKLINNDGNNRGYFSCCGREIIPAEYHDIKQYSNCFVVSKIIDNKLKLGLYSVSGKEILKVRYDKYDINSPYIIFYLGKKACAYDLYTGKRILPLKYKNIRVYYNVICATQDDKTFNIYSASTGRKLCEHDFELRSGYDPFVVAPYVLNVCANNKSYYYLTQYNTLLDAKKYTVTYSEEYKQVLISDGKNKEIPFVDWLETNK